jgi:ATP-dependent DNA helicase UvrD/PcrA
MKTSYPFLEPRSSSTYSRKTGLGASELGFGLKKIKERESMLSDQTSSVAFQPTDEQTEIISLAQAKENLQITAFAGTGKTATLRMLAEKLNGPILYCAFNKRIIEEASELQGFPGDCRTLNSIGHRVWAKTIPGRISIDGKKTYNIFKEVVKGYKGEDSKALWDSYGELTEAVSLAKAAGYIPKGIPQQGRALVGEEFWGQTNCASLLQRSVVDSILSMSIRAGYDGGCDFDDQLYLPTLFGGSFPRFPVVMVDEEQDLNAVNHEMVRKLTRSGRLISVGDPYQSIYGFRGAIPGGMEINRDRFRMLSQTLTVSFRCPSEIVRNARWRVPEFKWRRSGGRVRQLESLDLTSVVDGAAIICRNNAPLFRQALTLLSMGRPCRVAGSDVGPKLVNLLRRLGDSSLSRSAVLGLIDAYAERKADSRQASDFADCMRIFAQASRTLAEAIARAEFVLKQDGPITLITGHKAKGLEWDTVYHLDPWLIGKEDQELNLRYVVQTRAREAYYEINSRDILNPSL